MRMLTRFIPPIKFETVRGPWFSMGFHIDFHKRYIDLHLIWWIITIGSDYYQEQVVSEGDNVWIVGRETARLDGHPDYFTWDFLGAYDDYDLALKKCITKGHFLFGVSLNQAMGELDRGWQERMFHLTREIKQREDTPW